MRNSTGLWLVVIAAITILVIYMILPNNGLFGRPIEVRPGLDIQGGLRVLLAADVQGFVEPGKMEQAKQIVDRRVNGLGVAEPVVQLSGGNRIIVELPGLRNRQAAIDTVKQTGLLEFVDFSKTGACAAEMPKDNQYVLTDRQVALRGSQPTPAATAAATGAATGTATSAATPTGAAPTAATPQATAPQAVFSIAQGTAAATTTPQPTVQPTVQPTGQPTAAATTAATAAATAQPTAQATPGIGVEGTKERPLNNPCTGQPFTTVMTGAGLGSAEQGIGGQNQNEYVVKFTLAGNAESQNFVKHTATHIGQPLAIVLDGQVISAPVIQSALPQGGEILGNFTREAAQTLALQLRYGALPVSLRVESIEEVGASLGAEAIQASLRAGIVGIIAVLIFMLIYYRLPGLAADIALILFAAINFALYKFIPVTITLPALVGFLISVGAAVDGNFLIFERIKEELRAGRPLAKAIDLGFSRAWPSIRESNISTIIIALIVYFFGGQFGAGAVRGFAVTLILGLATNLFTAVIVTRTLLNVIMILGGESLQSSRLFGISEKRDAAFVATGKGDSSDG
jgi:protein-export membrane protein SecD